MRTIQLPQPLQTCGSRALPLDFSCRGSASARAHAAACARLECMRRPRFASPTRAPASARAHAALCARLECMRRHARTTSPAAPASHAAHAGAASTSSGSSTLSASTSGRSACAHTGSDMRRGWAGRAEIPGRGARCVFYARWRLCLARMVSKCDVRFCSKLYWRIVAITRGRAAKTYAHTQAQHSTLRIWATCR